MRLLDIAGFFWELKFVEIDPNQSPVAVTWRLAPSTRSQRTAARFWEAPGRDGRWLQASGFLRFGGEIQGFLWIFP